MSVTKTLAAGLVAASLAVTPASATTSKSSISTETIVLGAIALAVVGLIVANSMGGGDSFFSTKDVKGTDGNPLPGSPSLSNTTVIQDF